MIPTITLWDVPIKKMRSGFCDRLNELKLSDNRFSLSGKVLTDNFELQLYSEFYAESLGINELQESGILAENGEDLLI